MTLYKLTDPSGKPVHGGTGSWSKPRGAKPGAWREVTGKLVPCQNGLHVLRVQDIGNWLRAGVLWEVEVEGEQIVHENNKVVVRKARLLHKAAVIDDKTLRLLACDFAEHVLPIFEKKRPGDLRPREAIAAARAYARGEITIGELRAKRAADAAADAAAYATYAAADAAYAAAADATYAASAAADAAAYAAAAAAARSKERAWQANRISEVLGLTPAPSKGEAPE